MTTQNESQPQPFKISFSGRNPITQKILPLVESPLERFFNFHQINTKYAQISPEQDCNAFLTRVLEILNINYQVSEQELARIPQTGRVIIVSNHPFGMIEGIILAALLKSVRDDLKIMANYLLSKIEQLREILIMTDPFEKPDSYKTNYKALKEAIGWLKHGGMLSIFPAGEVSHIHLKKRSIIDPEWNDTVARLVRLTKTPVLPVFFKGSNGALFQLMGLIHPTFRTLMLPQQLLNKVDKTIEIRIGNLIPYAKLSKIDSAKEMTEYLRLRTYILQNCDQNPTANSPGKNKNSISKSQPTEPAPIIPAVKTGSLTHELSRLPARQSLVENSDYQVFYAKAYQSPFILREIGRLREVTFRAAGEGTGKSIDLDAFDDYYYHLFIWHKANQEIVGAYRLGASEEILKQFGPGGFYTSTLYKFKPNLLSKINPALELGRSFIRIEYQRAYSSLLLLWKGIGQFILQFPQYRYLFGTVSISDDYHPVSKRLMISFLKLNNFLPRMAKMVKAKTPVSKKLSKGWPPKTTKYDSQDINDVSELISDIEADSKGVPILIKQYLKLGGKFLGFNSDPDFGNVLDGLILVDLLETDTKTLERYMGKEGLEAYLNYHDMASAESAPIAQQA